MSTLRRLGPLAAAALLLTSSGCAGAPRPPTAQEVWHEAGLRPSRVGTVDGAETALLARLSTVPADHAVTFAGRTFVVGATYTAASDRPCRAVQAVPAASASLSSSLAGARGVEASSSEASSSDAASDASPTPVHTPTLRLACAFGDTWAFVPNVFAGDSER